MPPRSENPITLDSGTLYLIDTATGEETPLGPVKDLDTVETIEPAPIDTVVHRFNPAPEASFTISMPFRKMSRKRFVKKLMGWGVPRNTANKMAKIAHHYNTSYSWGYQVLLLTGFFMLK